MIQALEQLPRTKVTLTIPLVASYLCCNYKMTHIAKHTGHSHQWVSEFIRKNYDALMPLIDKEDVYAAMQAKHVAKLAKDKLDEVLNTCTDFSKRDLIPLTAVSDRHTQQYRLLSDKSTANIITKESIGSDQDDINQERAQLRQQLAKLNGD